MREAAGTILEALERVPSARREDRLTEVFAHTLRAVPELAVWLVSQAQSAPRPKPGARIRVSTQGELAGSGRPDLHLNYEDMEGRSRLLLSEHKLDAGLTEYQRLGYPGWVDRHALVLIAPDASRYVTEAPAFDAYLTWLHVAEEVNRIGELGEGGRWRQRALAAAAPAWLRGLHELLTLLEHDGIGGSMEPLSAEIVGAYGHIVEAQAQVKNLLRLLGDDQRLSVYEPYGVTEAGPSWFLGLNVAWDLLDGVDRDYGAAITIEPSVQWLTDTVEGPALYAGFYFAITDGRLPVVFRDSPALAAGLQAADCVVAPQNRRQAQCAKVLPLSEVSAHATALSGQVDFVAEWVMAAFDAIAALTL